MPVDCLHNLYSEIDGGLPIRQSLRSRPLVDRVCEECRAGFQVERRRVRPGRGRFCSRACARRWSILRYNELHPPVGAGNRAWKGGVAKQHYRYALRFRLRFPEKRRAQQMVADLIRSGRMIRPDTCSACASPCKPHAHHDDYTQPLVVRWLCGVCHRAHHAAQRKAAA